MKRNYFSNFLLDLTRKVFTLFLLFFAISYTIFSQVPERFNYQAVVRGQDGKILSDQQVSFRISILAGSVDGAPVYIETHIITTTSIGLATLEIGGGTVESGDFSIIDWGKYTYYMKIEMDTEGGTNYSFMGTTQLLSVPYALYARDVENKDDADADPNNELISTASLNGTTLEITDAGGTKQVDLSPLATGSATDDQILFINGHQLSIENGNEVTLPDETRDADADTTNEIQDLQLSGNTLKITGNLNATPLDLSKYLDNTDSQNLTLTGTTLGIQNGNNVDLSGIGGGTDSQTLSLEGNTLGITNGNTVDLSKYLDNTDNQDLVLTGDVLSIENGTGNVNLANYRDDADADTTNEIQDLQLISNTLKITGNGSATPIDLNPYLDNTDNQTLNLTGNTLGISNGNTLDLSKYLDNTDAQSLNLANNILSISNGDSIDLSKYLDNTDNQGLVLTGDVLSIENGTGNVNLANYRDDADADPTNELQILSISNDTIYLSNGGFVKLPPQQPDNDWQTNGTDIYRQTGSVGIGTTTPSEKLEVNGNVKADTLIGDGSRLTGIPGSGGWTDQGSYISAQKAQNASNVVITDKGYVGIGTTTPTGELHVNNPGEWQGVSFTGTGLNDLSVNYSGYTGSGTTYYIAEVTNAGPDPNIFKWSNDNGNTWTEDVAMATSGIDVGYGVTIGFGSTSGHTYGVQWRWSVTEDYLDELVVKDGKVGIGTNNPNEKLTVNGVIESKEGFKFPDGTIQNTKAPRVFRRIFIDKNSSNISIPGDQCDTLFKHTILSGQLQDEMLLIIKGETKILHNYSTNGGSNGIYGSLYLYINNTLVDKSPNIPGYLGGNSQDVRDVWATDDVTFIESYTSSDINFNNNIEIMVLGCIQEDNDHELTSGVNFAKYLSTIIYGK